MTYNVEVNFGGYIGCSDIYTVDADDEDDARELALELAIDDLSVESVEPEI